MELVTKKRSENWNEEEKEILRQIISESAHILENKSTKAQINIEKIKEWKNVTTKFNEITGRNRSNDQVKLAWKRMKLNAKANLSFHRQQQSCTGGGPKPLSPSQEDLKIMEIAPHDFIIDHNYYDSDAVVHVEISQATDKIDNPSTSFSTDTDPLTIVEAIRESPIPAKQDVPKQPTKTNKNNQKISVNRVHDYNMKKSIMDSNINYKKRHLEMLQVEHDYNIRIAQLKIKKLELEIAQLENNNDK